MTGNCRHNQPEGHCCHCEIEKKSFLECMFNDLDDIYEGSDDEVKEELIEMGIDVEKAKADFLELIGVLRLKETK